MTASVGLLSFLVGGALLLVGLTPVVLLLLWLRDARKGQLW